MAAMTATYRKIPRQARSKNTVRRILQAAIEVLEERGYEGASTNQIAAAAGISPGSLYQYFLNKEAILDAVISAYAQQLLDRITLRLSELLQADPKVLVSAAIEAQVDAMLEQPEMLRIIYTELPGQTSADLLRPLEALIAATIKGYAAAHADPHGDMNVDAAAWIIAQLLGATLRYVVDEPPIAKDVYVAEMTRLVQSHPIASGCPRAAEAANAGTPRASERTTQRLGLSAVGDHQPAGIWDAANGSDREARPLVPAG